MGKRKERRLAAKSNGGRRVKLELFSEPSSGDLGGSSVQEEVGVENEPKHRAVTPNSPSTSGQPQNPLLLLGQYSDDELEEVSDKKPDNASTGETSSPVNKDEAEISKGEVGLAVYVNGDEVKKHEINNDTASLNIYQSLEDASTSNNEVTGSSDVSKDLYTGQASASMEARELNVDVSSSWQMVLHEESNQYYYWNMTTGETSWEVPVALSRQADMSANDKTLTVNEMTEIKAINAHDPTLSSGVTTNDKRMTNEGQHDVNWRNSCSVEASLDENLARVDSVIDTVDESGIDLSSSLIKHGESLLERLKSVNGSKTQERSLNILKYTLEVEIRLFDIKALSSFGPSLRHFWAHSDKQLRQLEDSINLEIYKFAQSAITDDTFQESTEPEPEANEIGNTYSSPLEDTQVSPISDTSSLIPKDQSGHAESLGAQANGGPGPDDLIPKQDLQHAVDDFDMDVDMEVEDEPPNDVEESSPNEFLEPPREIDIPPPPPPDEEWVPPPPPDTEQIPPPLPIEPPEPIYIDPSVQYAEQYNLSYPNASFGYYGHTDVSQVYYSAVPSTYAETPQIAPTHVVPVSYYEFQDGVVPPVPGVSSVESSQFQAGPIPIITYGSGYNRSGSVESLSVEASHSNTSVGVAEKETTIEAHAILSVKDNIPLQSTVSASSEATKVETKVVRSKKRPPTVASISRPSKKVSSLVNKWKAAKEELLEDEEPQNAYEMLERKRQKEIEEWRAQQIASGEAKDNANFQPLGGDWRERVKRRRAKLARKASEPASPVENNNENKQPSLAELSKDLPSGWQVYWDESSKQVYYGNVVTSETTWTRPKK